MKADDLITADRRINSRQVTEKLSTSQERAISTPSKTTMSHLERPPRSHERGVILLQGKAITALRSGGTRVAKPKVMKLLDHRVSLLLANLSPETAV